MDFETNNYRFDRKRNISGWDEVRKFKIEVKNTRDIGVKVEIQRNFTTQYWKLNTSQEFEQVDLDTVKFTLILEPRSKRVFEYTFVNVVMSLVIVSGTLSRAVYSCCCRAASLCFLSFRSLFKMT